MKALIAMVGFVLLVISALATPIAVIYGVYEWVGNDTEFKYALWEGVKLWVIMLLGLVVGYPMVMLSK